MSVEVITSLQNPLIKQTIALREAGVRREKQFMLIDGVREIERACHAGVEIDKIFVCRPLWQRRPQQQLLALLKQSAKIIEVNQTVFEKMTFGQRLEGLLAIARMPHKALCDLKPKAQGLYVMVESLEKPGNLGAILRTCDAAGVDGLLIADVKTDLYNPNVIRASTGCVFTVPTAIADHQAILDFVKRYKIKTCGLFPQGHQEYTQADLTGPLAIILGSEDKGLSDFWHQHADTSIKIPMQGQVDSLNVSVCAAIVIYEALRQRSLDKSSLRI